MKTKHAFLGATLTGTLLIGLSASAQTFVTSTTYGGHTYELWQGSVSWGTAESDAVADGGYLAVLTTSAETTAVYNGLIGNGFFTQPGSQGNSAWLGATPADGSTSTRDPNNLGVGGWRTVDSV
jgi:hypothetical protein